MIDRDQLAKEYPGGLRTRVIGSTEYVSLGDRTITVRPMASDQEIASALGLVDSASGNATAVIPAAAAPAPSPVVASKPIPAAGGFTPGSLKALLQGLRTRQQSVMSEAVDEAKAMNAALDQVQQMSTSIKATTTSILSEIGQFSNMPPEGE
jgi:hypothetical protein